jgi:hypothetical protein
VDSNMKEQIVDFLWFTFQPLQFEQFITHFQEDYDLTLGKAQDIFDEWLYNFYFRARVFYIAQYRQHHNALSWVFQRKYQVPAELVYDYGLEDVWEEYKRRSGLPKHHEEYNSQISYVQAEMQAIKRRWKQKGYDLSHRVSNFLSECLEGTKFPDRKINELWFNTLINNSPEEIIALRKLPYQEYLNTQHWKRVRAATLLIHRAVCQEESCYQIDESYYFGGWEADIHVHHLNYDNLGNERYNDLTLLCSSHHKKWHENVDRFGEPRIRIVTDIE